MSEFKLKRDRLKSVEKSRFEVSIWGRLNAWTGKQRFFKLPKANISIIT
ncbi:hypothetical protein OGM63_10500 [Plectonema radiosum NIES-515]|uniref:Uncharacterized protein n=1 Tax=Plectonema radiosum NIES-515 TaxID=2986073 RepID=A0ABT3AXT0_9CYAN|nr:hypothetical protein [Plectonema radiosum]MCV3213938.1 hypothetical protein [Plectonema radiosum NIES-515]